MISFTENIYYEKKITMTRKEMKKPLKKMKKIVFNHTDLPMNTIQIKPTRTNYVSNENYINQISDFIKLLNC